MANTYNVHLICEDEDLDKIIECADDTNILEQAESQGIDLPYSCRAGACSSCAGRLLEGEIDQTEQAFLDEEKLDAGFILTCVAFPKSDCKIQAHVEDEIF
uniref:ferredoxin n=1 Tax=Sporochnus bolleanus TaxID=461143 RepID=UPI002E75AC48|nr:ferredoxin [Sporochnus bolleanus]WAM64812.1 ferredoxin [Sporochnus bolleanus]